jgi:hypothetical protein
MIVLTAVQAISSILSLSIVRFGGLIATLQAYFDEILESLEIHSQPLSFRFMVLSAEQPFAVL